MLERLLREIETCGSMDTRRLAERMHTTPDLIVMMMEELERQGRLTLLMDGCASQGERSPCEGCAISAVCLPPHSGRAWAFNRAPSAAETAKK